ncbi:hypothetical protein [Motilibacter aurantiacus]|uniref:hypothetical protein n=1 Tax=Motilibacter aurantiacus TaxID=2714955 RepID=UPI001409E897|nr:hypothetical protein [Motilibacter aurantiacus]NHC45012.1 hypothetical protein [Motilibacter aurantiacus]
MGSRDEACARRADVVELEATRLERQGEALRQMAATTVGDMSERYAAAAAVAFELAEEALARADQLRALDRSARGDVLVGNAAR